jgi:F420-dependent oxidoreductase-like protein
VPTHAQTPITRLGLQLPSFTFPNTPDHDLFDRVSAIATAAETAGFDSIWVMDHFYQIGNVGPRTDPMFEAYSLLAAIAARTGRARLGAMVTGVTYRNPALLAKTVTTLDVISQGRAILGLGAAWNEDEHTGYGFAFPPLRERFERLEDALQICRAMFTQPEATVTGRHYHTTKALNFPRPVTAGGPPILVGGGGETKTIPLLARYADGCNFFGDPDTIRRKLAVLDAACDAAGRDPALITRTRLGGLILADTRADADRKLDEFARTRNRSLDWARGYAIYGSADELAERANELRTLGLDGLIFNMPNAYDLDAVARVGRALAVV